MIFIIRLEESQDGWEHQGMGKWQGSQQVGRHIVLDDQNKKSIIS